MKEVDIHEVAKSLFILLPTINRKLIRPMEQHVKHKLSPMQMNTLFILNEKESITMTELAKEMNVSKQQLTPIIDKLIESYLVCREYNANDRRIVKIRITSAGGDFLEYIHKDIASNIEARIECLVKEDLVTLQDSLIDINMVINKIL
jgi:DNA-binding MarR family transcriptional regulator